MKTEIKKPLYKIENKFKNLLTDKKTNLLIVEDFNDLIDDLKNNTTIKGFNNNYFLNILKDNNIKINSTIIMRLSRCLRSENLKLNEFLTTRNFKNISFFGIVNKNNRGKEIIIYDIK
tara:strand:- start:80 stop:433 length:354 start_codon:yes stop_codon:yes gene_type:complete